jgi:predicted TPR repeat methyltransferase
MPDINIEQAMRLALRRHQAGQLADAEEIYRQILQHQPRNADALRLLGVIARQQGRFDSAVELIRRSIAIDPNRAEAHHNLGDALRSQAKLDEAIASYARAAELRPDWPEARGALGNALRERGDIDHAVEELKKVVQLNPASAPGFLSLGKALHQQGKRGKAIAAFATAAQLKPDWPDAHDNLGNAFWDEQRLDEAIFAYSRAIELDPGHVSANWSMGKILSRLGKTDESLACFRRAVDFNPDNPKAHYFLARFLEKAGRSEQAAASYRHAIRLSPDTPEWRFKLAVLSGDGSARTAPPRYIRDLFDEYAPTFDRHLVQSLNYQAPRQLLDSVQAATDRRDLDILDLGCGTGLCGKEFRPHARTLVGVDLSPAMIRAAEARGIYDHLITAELMAALRDSPLKFDLIVAGDVLIYVGDLTDFLPAVAASLCPGGLFAASIESYEGSGFFLHGESRFAHSIDYLRQRAAASGLREVSARQVILRRNEGADVAGWIVLLNKPE